MISFQIDESNVFELMEAADMFQISLMKLPISVHLMKCLYPSNCFQIYAYAERYNYFELKDKVLQFICEKFQNVVDEPSFQETPLDILVSILCNDSLSQIDICCVSIKNETIYT